MDPISYVMFVVICTSLDGIQDCKNARQEFSSYEECADLVSDMFAARGSEAQITAMNATCYMDPYPPLPDMDPPVIELIPPEE